MATASKRFTNGYADGAILYLDQGEAETLRFLVMRCAGSEKTSPRGFTDAINKVLQAAGVDELDARIESGGVWGIQFANGPHPEPPFRAGYFKDTGDGEVRRFETQSALDQATTWQAGTWVRVTVTEVE